MKIDDRTTNAGLLLIGAGVVIAVSLARSYWIIFACLGLFVGVMWVQWRQQKNLIARLSSLDEVALEKLLAELSQQERRKLLAMIQRHHI